MNWYAVVLRKYAEFNGRARRTEYWMFTLISMLISWTLSIVSFGFSSDSYYDGDTILSLSSFYSLAVFIPSLAVAVRRLHDTNRSGWFLLLCLIPIVGWIILLVFLATEGQNSDNQYGKNPKESFYNASN